MGQNARVGDIWRGAIAISLFTWSIGGGSHFVLAQITPDRSLSTRTTSTDNLNFVIDDGEQVGANLFHSFDQFSVPTDGTAHFNNGLDVDIIFSRVTGKTISTIDGLLSANGTADLFLINPNGLVLGPNAQLDIGGSFIGSTAESLIFADGTEFRATATTHDSLLTISTPIGLQLGRSSGSIEVQGNGHEVTVGLFSPLAYNNTVSELGVDKGETLALIGNGIEMSGGIIRAPGGQVQLGSVETGQVRLDPHNSSWQFDYDPVQTFADIQLTDGSLVDTGGIDTGDITLQGQTIGLNQGSIIAIQNLGDRASGAIALNATHDITIAGAIRTAPDQESPFGILSGVVPSLVGTDARSAGDGGNISTASRNLTLMNGGAMIARSYGDSSAGTINTTVAQGLTINRSSSLNAELVSVLGISSFNASNGGELNISAQTVTVTEGGTITSFNLSSGQGGNVTLDIAEDLIIDGINRQTALPSNVGTLTFGEGKSGDLTVNVGQLTIDNGGSLNASTFSSGDAGQLTINASQGINVRGRNPGLESIGSSINAGTLTDSVSIDPEVFNPTLATNQPTGRAGMLIITTPLLQVTDNGIVGTANFGLGNGGDISINADRIMLDDGRIGAFSASNQGGNVELQVRETLIAHNDSEISVEAGGLEIDGILVSFTPLSADSSDTHRDLSSVDGGSLRITAGEIRLSQESEITANTLSGQGCDITVLSEQPLQLNHSRITSTTASGNGGNIQVNSETLLFLDNQSSISTTAGQTGAGGNGGNISLRVPYVVGALSGNSDITANAFTGNGGNISIATQQLFGLEFRDRLTLGNDITATSEFGLDGSVEINNPEVDPGAQVLELLDTLVDASQLVRPGCSLDEDQFVLAGRGGLPDSPIELMTGDRPWFNLRDLSAFLNNPSDNLASSPAEQLVAVESLQEATGMAIAPNGQAQLIAPSPNATIIPHKRLCERNPIG